MTFRLIDLVCFETKKYILDRMWLKAITKGFIKSISQDGYGSFIRMTVFRTKSFENEHSCIAKSFLLNAVMKFSRLGNLTLPHNF